MGEVYNFGDMSIQVEKYEPKRENAKTRIYVAIKFLPVSRVKVGEKIYAIKKPMKNRKWNLEFLKASKHSLMVEFAK
jgi:hypothetical protein